MPKVVDMKMTKEDREENLKETAISQAMPEYPYGLTISLDEDSIKKLNIDRLPAPGTEVGGSFKARVESASISKDSNGQRRHLTLQIVKLGIGGMDEIEEDSERVDNTGDGPPKPSADKVLFSD